jgi:hypothetical protein
MNKQNKIILIFVVVLILITIVFAVLELKNKEETVLINYDDFAKCLRENDAVMYGAESCSHCKEQKNVFGNSFKYINYVECPENINLCLDRGIRGYPTWIIGTSTKIEGFDENTMQELSRATSCPLPLPKE